MNTEILKRLIALAETGSFSAAGLINGVTQPAISLSVKKMENELGTVLFERRGNRVVPTESGQIFLFHARKILEAESALLSALEKHALHPKKILIASSNIPGEYILPLILGNFKKEMPNIEPAIEIMNSARVIECVRKKEYEIGFIGKSTAPADLNILPFCPDALLIICSPEHPLADRKKVSPESLKDEMFIFREHGSATRELMENAMIKIGLDPDKIRIEMELGSTSSVISAVASGAGISMVSAWAVRNQLKEGIIKTFSVVGLNARRQFSVISKKERKLSEEVYRFEQFVLGMKGYLEKTAHEYGIS